MDQPRLYMKQIQKDKEDDSDFEIIANHFDCSFYSKQVITNQNAIITLYHKENVLFYKEFKFQVSDRFYGFSSNGQTFYICSQFKKKILFIDLNSQNKEPLKLKFQIGIDSVYVNDFLIVQHKENMFICYTFQGKIICEHNEKYGLSIASLSCQDNSFLLQDKYQANNIKIMDFTKKKLKKLGEIRVFRNIFCNYLQSVNKQFVYQIIQNSLFIKIRIYQKITNKLQLIRKFDPSKLFNNIRVFIEKLFNKPFLFQIDSNSKVVLLLIDEAHGEIKPYGQLKDIQSVYIGYQDILRIINQNENDNLNNLKYLAQKQYGWIVEQ